MEDIFGNANNKEISTQSDMKENVGKIKKKLEKKEKKLKEMKKKWKTAKKNGKKWRKQKREYKKYKKEIAQEFKNYMEKNENDHNKIIDFLRIISKTPTLKKEVGEMVSPTFILTRLTDGRD